MEINISQSVVTINNSTPKLNLTKELSLTNNRFVKGIVDAKYYDQIIEFSNWFLSDGYIISTRGNSTIPLAKWVVCIEGRFIDGLQIDHKDRNPLNNTSSNLRMATPKQQIRNRDKMSSFKTSSKYIG